MIIQGLDNFLILGMPISQYPHGSQDIHMEPESCVMELGSSIMEPRSCVIEPRKLRYGTLEPKINYVPDMLPPDGDFSLAPGFSQNLNSLMHCNSKECKLITKRLKDK